MTPEEKRALLKREMLKESMASDDFRQASAPQKPAGTPEPFMDPIEDAQAFGLGAVQGATFELGDELGGAVMATGDVITGKGPLTSAPDMYKSRRDKIRGYLDEKRRYSPGSFAMGSFAGSLGTAVPASKLMGSVGAGRRAKAGVEAVRLEGEASKALTVADSTALMKSADNAAGKAQGLGSFSRSARDSAAQGYGASDSDSTLGDLGNAATTGVIGGIVGKVAGGIDPGAVRARANEKGLKAAGAMTKDFRNLTRKGFADDTGKWINENVIDKPFMTLEQVSEKAGARREQSGNVIGNIIDGADSLRERAKKMITDRVLSKPGLAAQGQTSAVQKQINDAVDREYGFSMANVADRIDELTKRDSTVAASHAHAPRLQGLAQTFREIASTGEASLRTGLRNKTETRRLLKDVDNLGEEYKQEVYDIISDELEKSVGKFDHLSETMAKYTQDPVAKAVAGGSRKALTPGDAVDFPVAKPAQELGDEGRQTAQNFRDANREYARSATTQKMAENRLGNVKSNRDFGLSTAIAAQTGALLGGPVGAVASGGINNLARSYGASSQAFVFHRLANILEKSPEAFGKYAPVLRTALARGASSFLLTHHLLAKKDRQYGQFSERLIQEEP